MNDAAYVTFVEERKPDKLDKVTRLVIEMLEVGQEVEQKTKELAELQQKYTRYSEQLVPTALADAQLLDFTLNTGKGEPFHGWKIGMEVQIHAGIPKPREKEAFEWLRRHKRAAIIKRMLSIEFGMGDEKFALRVLGYFKRWHAHRKFADKESIHSGTLKKFVREMIQAEHDEEEPLPEAQRLPRDLFGVYERTVTIVQIPEENAQL
jgi:hypothetical protein